MLFGLTLIILSILAVPSLLLSKKPDAQKYLNILAPWQGWIGLVFFLWGVWGIISCILNISIISFGLWGLIWWITWIATALVEAILGFILGYNLIAKYILSKNEAAKAKGEELLAKLASVQGKLGIGGIIVGAWCIICSFLL
jgi:hypothetical protein